MEKFYIDNHNLLIELVTDWENSKKGKTVYIPAIGDALWRTAIGLITLPKSNSNERSYLLLGILKCLQGKSLNNSYSGPIRHPEHESDDCSRDQVIMAMSALLISKNNLIARKFASDLKYRISKRYTMVPSMWLWIKSISSRSEIKYNILINLFSIFFTIECVLSYISTQLGLFFGINKMIYPAYALHLSAWQMHSINVSKKSQRFKLCRSILLKLQKQLDPENVVVRVLLGEKINRYPSVLNSMNGCIWEVYRNRTDRYMYYLSTEEINHLTIDKLMFDYAKSVNNDN
jgi:hypothetical protein